VQWKCKWKELCLLQLPTHLPTQRINQPTKKETNKPTDWPTNKQTNKQIKQPTSQPTNQPAHLLTSLLTDYMHESPAWKVNRSLASRRISLTQWNWRLINAFPRTRNSSLSWPIQTLSTPFHPISVRSIVIISSHLRLGQF